MRFYFGKRFDNNGDFAAAGRVLPRFLEILCREQFINKIPPKSTGREYFNWEYVEAAMFGTVFDFNPAEDVIRTLTEFTAWSIAENIRLFANPASRIIASGGGTLNKTLMSALSTYLPQATILTSDEVGIPSSAKEALCFGFLAYLTLLGKPGNVPSVTGASRKAVLGSVALPPEIVS
jgi:anhydro-N-acetylmuramic acid kinase